MHIIKEIGAYAGLAAIVGLAVLSALYFSQARDVKRLREWAGRAPERASEQAAQQAAAPTGGVVSQPAPGRAAPAPARPAAAQPAAAGAAAPSAGGKPAAATPAGQKQATPAEAPKPAAQPAPAGATAGAGAATKEAVPAGDGAESGGGQAKPATEAGQAPAPAPAARAAPTAQSPSSPAPATPRPRLPSRPWGGQGPASPSQTAVLPASRGRWYRRLLANPRYLTVTLAGVLIVGGGAAYGVTQLGKEEGPTGSAGGDRFAPSGGSHKGAPQAPIKPSSVTVSVLNGTTVPGLAAQIGDSIQSFGFQLGNVTNSSNQQRAESVVLYSPGHAREAILVGRKLHIAQRETIDPQSRALAGDATVVVVVGGDKTP